MSRINTNVQSLIAQRVLGQNNKSLNNALERLSTGLRINRGKDDPAGLIASENLKAEITSLNAAVGNAERADQVVNIAEGGLQEVSGLLEELQGLLVSSANTAGLSQAEKQANQDQIDSILGTIDRLASATNFQGIKILNGNFDYQTTNVAGGVTDFQVNGAKFEGTSQDVDVVITTSAQQGQLALSFGTGQLDFANGTSTFTLEVTGSLGSRELSFTSGTVLADIAAAINTFTDTTGIVGAVSGTAVTLRSEDYGSREFVSVKTGGDAAAGLDTNGDGIIEYEADDSNVGNTTPASTFAAAANPVRDDGQNVDGTINGIAAVGDGLSLAVNTDFLNTEITFATTGTLNALTLGGGRAFTITGGGADFQLGSNVSIGDKVSLGISDIATRKLGTSALGLPRRAGLGPGLQRRRRQQPLDRPEDRRRGDRAGGHQPRPPRCVPEERRRCDHPEPRRRGREHRRRQQRHRRRGLRERDRRPDAEPDPRLRGPEHAGPGQLAAAGRAPASRVTPGAGARAGRIQPDALPGAPPTRGAFLFARPPPARPIRG
jgi:flagellin